MREQIAALAGVALFQGLRPRELERLEQIARRRRYDAGETIVRQGETGIAFFVVTRGRVGVAQRGPDGQERGLRIIGPGGSFGEMALLQERPRSASVIALEPTECLALARLDFLDLLRRSPEIAIQLLDTLSRRLVDAELRPGALAD